LPGLPSYGVMLGLGFLFGYLVARRHAKQVGLKEGVLEDLWVLAIVGGILGARLWHIMQYKDDDLGKLIFFWKDRGITGLVFYGGVIGACLATAIYLKCRKVPVLLSYDVITPSLSLGLAFGRVGCFLAGCCWGKECTLPWAVRFPGKVVEVVGENGKKILVPVGSGAFEEHFYKYPSEFTINSTLSKYVHPAQLYAVAAALVIFAVLQWFFKRRKRDGEVLWLFLILYPVARFVLEMFRSNDPADSPKIVLGMFSPAQVASAATFVVAVILFIRSRLRGPGTAALEAADDRAQTVRGEKKSRKKKGKGQ